MRIAHLTSAHPRHDIRIFIKECGTLARGGHEVSLIVADGLGEEVRDGVRIHDVGARTGGRLARMTRTVDRVIQAALRLRPDVAHFHDPELMLAALKLKKAGIRVVYDVHEDLPRQLLAKHWIPGMLRPLTSRVFEVLENRVASRFDAIVTSTPHIRTRFARVNARAVDVCNYPILSELVRETPWESRHNEVCYLGGITRIRGIGPIVAAMPDVPARLNLAGIWGEAGLKDELMASAGWSRVNDLGVLDRQGVAGVLARSKVGLVTLFPTPNYVDALPIKLFEYMAAGIPVVASDFPVWRAIVEDAGCGLLVDPQDPAAIAAAMNTLLADDQRAAAMGASGQRAVLAKYSWQAEGEKLLALYDQLA
ncbi:MULTISPECIES: glycosyltransferase family 4 protein [unclassified Paludibacterium]|uniref:glycosyltransferase family 4 protein n=1 Tax=unclassified Paludibacterium TaxID=2618429 RepID=UPI001C04A933|nr:glycosyltransferase family 4 protein [Paludibacterium sp. B53371]BEV72267.1 glycosyltransferase family 4 protein [Paludibacterium sp. THUN1379]